MVFAGHREVSSSRAFKDLKLPIQQNYLAQSFAINPMTISKAYSLLEAEGVLSRPRGARMQVAEIAGAKLSQTDWLGLLRPALETLLRQARELGLARAEIEDALKIILDQAEENP